MPTYIIVLIVLLIILTISITFMIYLSNQKMNTHFIKDNKEMNTHFIKDNEEKCPYCGEYMTIINEQHYCMNPDCACIDENTIKILKEVAYDYRVKVKKADWGNISFFKSIQEDTTDKYQLYGTVLLEENGSITISQFTVVDYNFDTEDNSKYYMIEYRLLGKWYMTYGYDEVSAWCNVLGKARVANREIYR